MVKIKLIKLTCEEAVYEYYPEGKATFGIISFNRMTKEPSLVKDDGEYRSVYRGHAYHRIKKYDLKGEFKEEDLIAWY